MDTATSNALMEGLSYIGPLMAKLYQTSEHPSRERLTGRRQRFFNYGF